MTIRLEKGQSINLVKNNGSKLTQFYVGCYWGGITKKRFFGLSSSTVDVDSDLSCLLFDATGKTIDILSIDYRFSDGSILPNRKDTYTKDHALCYVDNDRFDNEIIFIDLNRINLNVNSIVFFLNLYNDSEYSGDFSGIPYIYIRMFERMDTESGKLVIKNFAQYDVSTKTDCIGMRGLVLGKLYRHNGEWKFNAIGDAFPDRSIAHTIARVINDYSH